LSVIYFAVTSLLMAGLLTVPLSASKLFNSQEAEARIIEKDEAEMLGQQRCQIVVKMLGPFSVSKRMPSARIAA
jgi:hypothetical protein